MLADESSNTKVLSLSSLQLERKFLFSSSSLETIKLDISFCNRFLFLSSSVIFLSSSERSIFFVEINSDNSSLSFLNFSTTD